MIWVPKLIKGINLVTKQWCRYPRFCGSILWYSVVLTARLWHYEFRWKPPHDITMSSRSLGGGRILGSGKGLSPVAAAYPPGRSTTLLSPTPSSLSVTSSISTSQPSTDAQDLSSRVSLDHSDDSTPNGGAGGAPSLVCPICNEEMVSLHTLAANLFAY